jgi:hypothetical protein
LLNPSFVDAPLQLKSVQDAARAVGLKLDVMDASTERDIDAAFARMVESRVARSSSSPIHSCLVAAKKSLRSLQATRYRRLTVFVSSSRLPAL